MAYVHLGEALRHQAQKDEVVFHQPLKFEKLMKDAKAAYQTAAKIDPNNEFANHWGGFKEAWKNSES